MASFIETLFGKDGTHPKDVAQAYYDLNRQLGMQQGEDEEQQWRKMFDQAKLTPTGRPNPLDETGTTLEHVSPAQLYGNPKAGDGNMKPLPMPEIERWKQEIDGLIMSGNPVLQEQGLSMLAAYRQQANSTVKDDRTSKIKEYQFAVSQGYQGSFQEWLALNPTGTTVNIGEKGFTGSDILRDREGNIVPVDPMMTRQEASEKGYTYGSRPATEESRRSSAITMAQNDLDRLQQIMVESNADISGWQGLIKEWRTGSTVAGTLANTLLKGLGSNPSPEDIQALSLSAGLSNTILQAYRGAQVGPMEQIMFNKQLPVPGQDRKLFEQNMIRTKRNLEMLQRFQKTDRGFYGSAEYNQMYREADPETKREMKAFAESPEGQKLIQENIDAPPGWE